MLDEKKAPRGDPDVFKCLSWQEALEALRCPSRLGFRRGGRNPWMRTHCLGRYSASRNERPYPRGVQCVDVGSCWTFGRRSRDESLERDELPDR
jgi:hypothetical protein